MLFLPFLSGAGCTEGGRNEGTGRRAPSLTIGWWFTIIICSHNGPRAEPTDEEGWYATQPPATTLAHAPWHPAACRREFMLCFTQSWTSVTQTLAAGQEQGDGARVRARLGKLRASIGTWVSANLARVRRIRLTRQQAAACAAAVSVGLAACVFLRCSRHHPPPPSYSWRNRRYVCARACVRASGLSQFWGLVRQCARECAWQHVQVAGGVKVRRVGCLCRGERGR